MQHQPHSRHHDDANVPALVVPRRDGEGPNGGYPKQWCLQFLRNALEGHQKSEVSECADLPSRGAKVGTIALWRIDKADEWDIVALEAANAIVSSYDNSTLYRFRSKLAHPGEWVRENGGYLEYEIKVDTFGADKGFILLQHGTNWIRATSVQPPEWKMSCASKTIITPKQKNTQKSSLRMIVYYFYPILFHCLYSCCMIGSSLINF
jgi:hypothetical protein